MNVTKQYPVKRLLAGTIITSEGIQRNMLISRLYDTTIEMHPFSRETHSTPYVGLVASISPDKLTPGLIKEIERHALNSKTPDIFSFLLNNESLSTLPHGRLLSIGPQSIIIEI